MIWLVLIIELEMSGGLDVMMIMIVYEDFYVVKILINVVIDVYVYEVMISDVIDWF